MGDTRNSGLEGKHGRKPTLTEPETLPLAGRKSRFWRDSRQSDNREKTKGSSSRQASRTNRKNDSIHHILSHSPTPTPTPLKWGNWQGATVTSGQWRTALEIAGGPSGWPPNNGAVERKGNRDKDHRFWQSWADYLLFPLPALTEQETRASEGKPTCIWIPALPSLRSLNSSLSRAGDTNFESWCYEPDDLKHKRTQPKSQDSTDVLVPPPIPNERGFSAARRPDPLPRPPSRDQCHLFSGSSTTGMPLGRNWKRSWP